MKKKKEVSGTCVDCDNLMCIGEGDFICTADEPVLVMEDYAPSDGYFCCGGADYVSDEDEDDE